MPAWLLVGQRALQVQRDVDLALYAATPKIGLGSGGIEVDAAVGAVDVQRVGHGAVEAERQRAGADVELGVEGFRAVAERVDGAEVGVEIERDGVVGAGRG